MARTRSPFAPDGRAAAGALAACGGVPLLIEALRLSALDRRRDALTKLSVSNISFKEAPRRVIIAAYMKASADNTLPANARQIYYAAHPAILELTDKDRLDDHYFCQTLLSDYVSENAELTANWDVVFDARGHLVEPHTERSVPLGTIEVRQYLDGEPADAIVDAGASGFTWPTSGPENRFSIVLFFVRREGASSERFVRN